MHPSLAVRCCGGLAAAPPPQLATAYRLVHIAATTASRGCTTTLPFLVLPMMAAVAYASPQLVCLQPGKSGAAANSLHGFASMAVGEHNYKRTACKAASYIKKIPTWRYMPLCFKYQFCNRN